MKNIKSLAVLLLVISQNSWGYEEGWNYQNFYEEVDWCKQSIIFPSAQDYIKAGLSKNKSEEDLRVDAISMVPVFENIGSNMCYCTFNELAKDIKHTEYKRGDIVKQYMAIPRCQSSISQAMQSIKENPDQGKLK